MIKINFKILLTIMLISFYVSPSHALSLTQRWDETKKSCALVYQIIKEQYPATVICLASAITTAILIYVASRLHEQKNNLEQLAIPNYHELYAQAELELYKLRELYIARTYDGKIIDFSINQHAFYELHCKCPKALSQLNNLCLKLDLITIAGVLAFFTTLGSGVHSIKEIFDSEPAID